MSDFTGFRRPMMRPGVERRATDAGTVELVYLDGKRYIEVEFDDGSYDRYIHFLDLLTEGLHTSEELGLAFPGSAQELQELLDALDEQGMIAEGAVEPEPGMSGITAYAALRRLADEVRVTVRSPLAEALAEGTATREQLIGYAIEYWHVTHLCPRVMAPVLARDDLGGGVWNQLMRFYMIERNHDRLLEKSLIAVGVTREKLLRTQPLPATMAVMAAMGVYAYTFPLALVSVLFPMEEPELEFLELFKANCERLGLPAEFVGPIVEHSDVNEEEAHEAVSLDLLAEFPYLSAEAVLECGKAVVDVIEQRAGIDAEIVAWYGNGGTVRDFTATAYPVSAGREMSSVR